MAGTEKIGVSCPPPALSPADPLRGGLPSVGPPAPPPLPLDCAAAVDLLPLDAPLAAAARGRAPAVGFPPVDLRPPDPLPLDPLPLDPLAVDSLSGFSSVMACSCAVRAEGGCTPRAQRSDDHRHCTGVPDRLGDTPRPAISDVGARNLRSPCIRTAATPSSSAWTLHGNATSAGPIRAGRSTRDRGASRHLADHARCTRRRSRPTGKPATPGPAPQGVSGTGVAGTARWAESVRH